jgi:uncharacterized protein (TIGR03086 family)
VTTEQPAALVDGCRRALAGARALIDGVGREDLARPTPCDGWDVETLIAHMIGVAENFTTALRGGAVDPSVARGVRDLGGRDPAAAYARAADECLAAWAAPGALDGTIRLSVGPIPATLGIRIFTADQLIHSWDLARALGKAFSMPDDLAAQTLDMMRGFMASGARDRSAAFAPPVPCPDDAPLQDRLIAFSGRQP